MSAKSESVKRRMVELMLRLAPEEGYTAAQLDGITFMRSNRPLPVTPALYEPSIVIVIQGRKSGLHDGNLYVYDAQHYLVLALPLPQQGCPGATRSSPGPQASPPELERNPERAWVWVWFREWSWGCRVPS